MQHRKTVIVGFRFTLIQFRQYFRSFVTFIHLLKGIIGTGIFAMPKAFAQAGYMVGVIGGALIGTLLTYCIHILVSTF